MNVEDKTMSLFLEEQGFRSVRHLTGEELVDGDFIALDNEGDGDSKDKSEISFIDVSYIEFQKGFVGRELVFRVQNYLLDAGCAFIALEVETFIEDALQSQDDGKQNTIYLIGDTSQGVRSNIMIQWSKTKGFVLERSGAIPEKDDE